MNEKGFFGLSLLVTGLLFSGYSSIGQSSCFEECFDVFFPNVITPNNDGKNDFFTIALSERSCGCAITQVSLVVYNRWGKEVYCFFDPDFEVDELKWYGDTAEGDLSESSYYYRAEVSFGLPRSRTYKGWIRILREGKLQ